jgi:RNA polymerase sigma-70 factor (ECF subfamily)
MDAHAEIGAALVARRSELLRHARRLAGADAEDLFQATAEQALARAETYEPGSNARAWLYRVMGSVASNRGRRSSVLQRLVREGRGANAHARPVLHDEEAAVTRIDLLDALNELPEEFGPTLAAWWNTPSAAKTLGIPAGTVLSRKFRARARLTAALEERP